MKPRSSEWVHWAGACLALVSGVVALAILLLPLLLVLLMVLFDSTAHGIVVLLELLLSWLREFMPGNESGLPSFGIVAFHPLEVAFGSLMRAFPCLAGLMLILLNRRPGPGWWWIVLLWGSDIVIGGKAVAMVLLPGLVVAAIFALPLAALRRQ